MKSRLEGIRMQGKGLQYDNRNTNFYSYKFQKSLEFKKKKHCKSVKLP